MQNPRKAVDALKNSTRMLTAHGNNASTPPMVQATDVVSELEPRELCLTLLKAQIQTLSENKVR